MKLWSDIVGQRRPKRILERAVETGRIHHAYLFTGLEGVGKYTTALAFSAVVNCLERDEGEFRDACGECTSCRKIAQGYHPDVLTVAPGDGSNTIKLDQIDEITKASNKQPHEARSRMVVVDGAHAMTTQAANALLKTLEEPASRMKMILVTNQAHRLLETIVSRCQNLPFSGLERDGVLEVLRRELEASDEVDELPDDETLELAAGYGEGSVGRSLDILETGLLEERRNLIDRVVRRNAASTGELLDLAEELGKRGGHVEARLDVLKLFFRDLLLYKVTGRTDRAVNQDLDEVFEELADDYSVADLTDVLDDLFEADAMIEGNVNRQFLMESLLPKLHPTSR